jgi:hypothetical protein
MDSNCNASAALETHQPKSLKYLPLNRLCKMVIPNDERKLGRPEIGPNPKSLAGNLPDRAAG